MESDRCREERALFEQQSVEFQAGMMTQALLGFGHVPVPRGMVEIGQLLSEVTRSMEAMDHITAEDEATRAKITRGAIKEIYRLHQAN